MSWLQRLSWLRGFERMPDHGCPASARRYRPQIESLEDRCLPSTVTTLADAGPGSLRDAIANTPVGGTVDFQPGLTGTITLTSNTLTIDHSLTISGPGANTLTVSGSDRFGVLNVASGVTATLAGLSLVHGNSSEGGGIDNQGTLTVTHCILSGNQVLNTGDASGGGIANSGTLMVIVSTLTKNTASARAPVLGAAAAYGGGIYNSGALTVIASTLSDNEADASAPSLAHSNASGGGIYNRAKLTVVNSTFRGNSASSDSIAEGGAIANDGNLTVINSTLSQNSADGLFIRLGPSIWTSSLLILTNTIVAGNGIYGAITQADHSLIGNGDGSTGLVNGQNGNQVGTTANPIDPKLGPLQDNGGPTPTMALLPGSPAINAGNVAASPGPTDQRGLPRTVNGTIDMGAYEVQGARLDKLIFAIGGAPGHVQVRRVSDDALLADFTPYGPSYTGGIAVAIGDMDGDGVPDLVTAPLAGNPQVKIYSGQALLANFNSGNPDTALLTSFFAYDLNFNIGANVAVGDINHDGFADIVTGATAGNPQVKVYDGKAIAQHTFNPADPDASLLASFFAYGLNFNIGANVAVGDVNGNGFADIVTGATTGNPQVKVYDGQAIAQGTFNGANPDASLLASFFAFGLNFNIGAFVSVGDVTGNGFGDVIVGAAAGNPQVKVYDGQAIAQGTFNGANPDASLLASFFAYGLNFNIGTSVSAADFDVGGPADILTGAAQGAPHYRVVKGLASGIQPPAEHGIDTIATDLTGGVRVGA